MLFQFNIIGKEQQQKASSISCLQSFTYFWEGFWDRVRLENAEGDDAGAKGFFFFGNENGPCQDSPGRANLPGRRV